MKRYELLTCYVVVFALSFGCKQQSSAPKGTPPSAAALTAPTPQKRSEASTVEQATAAGLDPGYVKIADTVLDAGSALKASGACTNPADATTTAACTSAGNFQDAGVGDTAKALENPAARTQAAQGIQDQKQGMSTQQIAGLSILAIGGALAVAGGLMYLNSLRSGKTPALIPLNPKMTPEQMKAMQDADFKLIFDGGAVPDAFQKMKPAEWFQYRDSMFRNAAISVFNADPQTANTFIKNNKLVAPDVAFGNLPIRNGITRAMYENLYAVHKDTDFSKNTQFSEVEAAKLKAAGIDNAALNLTSEKYQKWAGNLYLDHMLANVYAPDKVPEDLQKLTVEEKAALLNHVDRVNTLKRFKEGRLANADLKAKLIGDRGELKAPDSLFPKDSEDVIKYKDGNLSREEYEKFYQKALKQDGINFLDWNKDIDTEVLADKPLPKPSDAVRKDVIDRGGKISGIEIARRERARLAMALREDVIVKFEHDQASELAKDGKYIDPETITTDPIRVGTKTVSKAEYKKFYEALPVDDKKVLILDEGGTYEMGGTYKAIHNEELNRPVSSKEIKEAGIKGAKGKGALAGPIMMAAGLVLGVAGGATAGLGLAGDANSPANAYMNTLQQAASDLEALDKDLGNTP